MSKGMDKSGVPWADYRWNPIEGCSPISEGCQNCYAATLAHRFHRPWGAPVFRPERLGQPLNTKKPGRVFVCSTSDFFHDCCDPLWQDKCGLVMAKDRYHTFLLLTKRPQNIQQWKGRMVDDGLWPCADWIGVTAENQDRYEERWGIRSAQSLYGFVSVEPMLGPVSLKRSHLDTLPDWIICGPENGAKKRPCDPAWIQALADECEDYGIPFFDKREDGIRREFPR